MQITKPNVAFKSFLPKGLSSVPENHVLSRGLQHVHGIRSQPLIPPQQRRCSLSSTRSRVFGALGGGRKGAGVLQPV